MANIGKGSDYQKAEDADRLNHKPVRHLTLSGYYAGTPICGAGRRPGDIYQHYSLTYSIEHLTDLCQDCKKLYEEMENEK